MHNVLLQGLQAAWLLEDPGKANSWDVVFNGFPEERLGSGRP